MQECVSLSLPRHNIILENIYTIDQRCNYKVINATINEKTSIIFQNRDNIEYSKIYYCQSIEDLFVCSMYELFEKGYVIRKCKNCKKFFVTKEKGNRRKYCYNYSPQDNNKTCYDYMNQKKSKEKRKKDEVIVLYTSITNRLRTRQSRAEDNEIIDLYNQELNYLSLEYDKMKKNIKSGSMKKEELIDFLKHYNEEDRKNWREKYGSSRNNKK